MIVQFKLNLLNNKVSLKIKVNIFIVAHDLLFELENSYMKNLIIVGHPYKKSFCYNGIFKTIFNEINKSGQELEVIDLYRDSFSRPRTKLIEKYKNLVLWSERIYIISPVWWFRLTPRMEVFFDEVLTPGFAYKVCKYNKDICISKTISKR